MARRPDERAKRKYVRRKPRPAHLWKPGQTGNPGGRFGTVNNVKNLAEACREYIGVVLGQFEDMLRDPDTRAETRLAICRELLDRAYGRPTQAVSLFGSDTEPPIKTLTNIRLDAEQMRVFIEKGRALDASV